jgi:hypothetical protein
VTRPTISTTVDATPLISKKTWVRATRYTPAVTIVAAWISAETGVGPSMASGSQTCSGTCADLPIAPARSSRAITVKTPEGCLPATWSVSTLEKLSEPRRRKTRTIPTSMKVSPIRVVMKAFLAALAAGTRSYQNPISR